MRVVVTGGSGFIGSYLARELLRRGALVGPDGATAPISRLILADRTPPRRDYSGDERVEVMTGDCADPDFLTRVIADDTASIFHMAALLTTETAADFDEGRRVNLTGMINLLERCRQLRRVPRLVFASSMSTYGAPLPDVVDDTVVQRPQNAYGAYKLIGEQLVEEYTRQGFIDGRGMRFSVVIIRPGKPDNVVSNVIAGIVREPLHGLDTYCPIPADTRFPVISPRRVAQGLALAHDIPAESFGPSRSMNFPSLSVTVQEMIDATARAAGNRALGRIDWRPDPAFQRLVDDWPKYFESEFANRHGIHAEASFDEVIQVYMEEHMLAPDG